MCNASYPIHGKKNTKKDWDGERVINSFWIHIMVIIFPGSNGLQMYAGRSKTVIWHKYIREKYL